MDACKGSLSTVIGFVQTFAGADLHVSHLFCVQLWRAEHWPYKLFYIVCDWPQRTLPRTKKRNWFSKCPQHLVHASLHTSFVMEHSEEF